MFDVGCWVLDVFNWFRGSKREILFGRILSPRERVRVRGNATAHIKLATFY